MIEPGKPLDTAVLVGVELPGADTAWTLQDSMAELTQLARTVDVEVVAELTQTLREINPATLIGKGKVEELVALRTASGINADGDRRHLRKAVASPGGEDSAVVGGKELSGFREIHGL